MTLVLSNVYRTFIETVRHCVAVEQMEAYISALTGLVVASRAYGRVFLATIPYVQSLGQDAHDRMLLAAAVIFLFFVYSVVCYLRGPTMGYGSGANNNWNRNINYNRPKFHKQHYKLEDVWQFTGKRTSVDLDFVRENPLCTKSAVDPVTKLPLSGHLIGRMTWTPVAKPTAAQREAQSSLSFDPSSNSNAGDKLLRAQLLGVNGSDPAFAEPSPSRGVKAGEAVSPEEALVLGWDFYAKLQTEDGNWAGDYGGPLFLLPGMVLTCFVTGFHLGDARLRAMVTYMSNHQQADGGWALHIEGPSTLYCTTMNYMAMRCAGVSPADRRMVAARSFLHQHGGAVQNPHWGKWWLAVMGAMPWEGVNPVPPELWLLPRWFPFHPGKMWCHSRMPYLGMSYIYGIKERAGLPFSHPMAAALRAELYPAAQPYAAVNFDAHRNSVAPIDLYAPHTVVMDVLMWGLRHVWEAHAPRWLFDRVRAQGTEFAAAYVDAEDLHTNYICIGPCNKVNNMLSVYYIHGPHSEQFQRHCARLDDYLYVAEDGMKMNGYNGSQLWDTAFAAQAIAAAGPVVAGRYKPMLEKMAAYFDAAQAREDVPHREKYFRTISKGGWPFSTNDHGWPIADCTAEGMRGALLLRSLNQLGVFDMGLGYSDGMGRLRGGHISPERFTDAVDVILAFHNPRSLWKPNDGGWATYEETRGGAWYEWLNPAEVWADLMIDYPYTELTSDCVQGLAMFHKHFPHIKTAAVKRAMAQGLDFVRSQQREDGSWYGSWAVCFTYGCWFGAKAIVAAGEPEGKDKDRLKRMCAFLLSKQREDGGWGESYVSCLVKEYSSVESTAVNTAWALLSLIHAQCQDRQAVERGIRCLIAKQTPQGDWKQEWCSGIFNRTCAITYTAYRNVFPLWAIAAYCNEYKYRAGGLGGGTVGASAVAVAVSLPDSLLLHAPAAGGAGRRKSVSAGPASTGLVASGGSTRRAAGGASPSPARASASTSSSVAGSARKRAGSRTPARRGR